MWAKPGQTHTKEMNFKYLCTQYQLGRFQRVTELNTGTSSQVWKLDTDGGAFLVRTLRDKEQGEREWKIFRHLRGCCFNAMPTILVPCVEQNGVCCQVQEYLSGSMPDPSRPGAAVAMARLAREMACALPEGVIHGDLGPWNLLLCEDERLRVIDFGEARCGDPYFDYASLFGGVINHTPAEQRKAVCGEFLRELDCDRKHLLEQLNCWAEQGIEAWSGRSEKMVSRFINARNWAEEYIYEL